MEPDRDMDDARIRHLLARLDHPVPTVSALEVIRRARAGRRTLAIRRAALILLTLGLAGTAYALPGSPLRGWVAAILGGRPEAPAARTSSHPAIQPSSKAAEAGIALVPGSHLLVQFQEPVGEAWVRVTLTEGAEVVARAPAGAATFTAGVDRLMVRIRGAPDTFAVEIPRTAPRVEIRAGSALLLLMRDGRATAAVPAAPDGTWLLPLEAK